MRITKRLTRISIVLNVVLFITSLFLFVFAVVQRMEEEQERMMSIQCEKMAIMERIRADSLAVMATTQRKIAEEQAAIAIQQMELARKKAIEAAQKPD